MAISRSISAAFAGITWRGALLALLYIVPPVVYFCLGAWWLFEHGYLLIGLAGWLGCTILFSVLSHKWLKDATKVLPPLDWEKPWTFAPRDAEAWKIVQSMADRTTDLSLDQLSQIQTYQDVTEELAVKVAACYYPRADKPLDKLPIVDLLVAIELAAEDLEELCRQIPVMDQLTPGHLKGLTKALGYAQTANDLYNFTLPVFKPVSGIPRLIVQKLVAEPAWRQTKEGLQRWLFRAYINRLGMHLVELSSGRLRVGSAAYRKNVRSQESAKPTPESAQEPSAKQDSTRTIPVRLLLPGVNFKQRRQVTGALRHVVESGQDQIAELLNSHLRSLNGIQYLSEIVWEDSTWPDDPTDILGENLEQNWTEAVQEWINSAMLVVDLRQETPLRQLELAERVIHYLTKIYDKEPDLPVSPILILTDSPEHLQINISQHLRSEVRLVHPMAILDEKEEAVESGDWHDDVLPLIAEISLMLPLARQRILAREMAREARQSGVRRVAGQVAHAAGRAGIDLLKGWLGRRTTTEPENANPTEKPPSESAPTSTEKKT